MKTFLVTRPDMPWRPIKTVHAHRMVQHDDGFLEFFDEAGGRIEAFAKGAWTDVKEV